MTNAQMIDCLDRRAVLNRLLQAILGGVLWIGIEAKNGT
jgi:hypothetical protein